MKSDKPVYLSELSPEESAIMIGNLWYKLGAHGFVYRWSIDGEWVKSTMDREKFEATIEVINKVRNKSKEELADPILCGCGNFLKEKDTTRCKECRDRQTSIQDEKSRGW